MAFKFSVSTGVSLTFFSSLIRVYYHKSSTSAHHIVKVYEEVKHFLNSAPPKILNEISRKKGIVGTPINVPESVAIGAKKNDYVLVE